MSKIFALVFLAAVIVGTMADYHAPAPAHHGGYHAPAPAAHTYAAKAPAAKCGANLLVGCAPSVAHVPCVPAHDHGHGGY